MTPDQFKEFKDEVREHIADTVRVTVNGKIDGMRVELREYIKEDTAWKKAAEPVIKLGTNITGFGRVIAYLFGIMAAIGASWGLIQYVGSRLFNK